MQCCEKNNDLHTPNERFAPITTGSSSHRYKLHIYQWQCLEKNKNLT